MGFTGELVRSVFSRNRSVDSRESKVRNNNNGVERRRWVSVKSYLCGDELNSVLAEEDSASVRSSESTVTQPIQEDLSEREEIKSEETVENVTQNKRPISSNSKLFNEEEAAILIQSAYRASLSRRQNEGNGWKTGKEELKLVTGSPDRKSFGTSIEVQTGNSTEVFSAEGEKIIVYHRAQQRFRTQVIKQKEDWDDSTVSSSVSKMRMQNKMEATTRRERALAYAFSQQLRIYSNRKSNKYNSIEPNMSWSWLERWMATRLPDTRSVESHTTKEHDLLSSNQRLAVRKRFLDVAREEKESCGSNEVPLHFDNYSATSQEVKDHGFRPTTTTKINFKAKRTVSRRKTVPSYQFPEVHHKVSKSGGSSNARKDYKQKEKQIGRREMKLNTPKASNE